MLPRTTHLLAMLSFLAQLSVSSPVYNMQPAYITATIGSTGRNIRNLPCISRKSNQSGVCMFAIDCLKANGTHLGTCIDRFYFGSCCHIEPLHEINENTIDAALIPSREPPHRMTTQPPSSSIPPSTVQLTSTTVTPSTTTTNITLTKQDTPLVTSQVVQTTTPEPSPSTILEDLDSYKITTFQSVDDVPVTVKPTTVRPKPTKTKTSTITTTKPTKATKPRPQTTPKPSTTYINRNTTQKVNATRPQTSPRPRPKPTKPVKITKPIHNATVTNPFPSTTPTPITTTPTSVPQRTTTSKSTKLTKKPSLVTKATLATRKPVTSTTSRVPVTVATTTPTTVALKTTTKLTTTTTSTTVTSADSTSTLSNEVLVAVNTTLNEAQRPDVNGNPATNEIEAAKPPVIHEDVSSTEESGATPTTSAPSLVTWSEINKNDTINTNVNTTSTSPSLENVSNPDDWVPVTDGWVLLPSLTTTPESVEVPENQTEKPEGGISSSTDLNQSTSDPLTSSTESINTSSVSSSTVSSSTEDVASSSSTEKTIPSSSSSSSSTEDVSAVPVDITSTPSTATSGLNMSDFTDVCGRRMVPEGRIVGGEKSAFGKWPWQISLRQWRTSTYLHKCGAALLNENWAITAAHCVDNVPPSDLLLRLGEHDLSTESEPYLHQERRVQIVASHPQFDPRTFEYDLALLRFYEPVTFQPNIIPVCVPQTDENFVGRNAHVTGWGRLYEDGPLPSVLQEVSVPVINNTVCESMYRSAGYIEHIPNIFICAGWRRGGFDSCEGDSGGPMVIQRPDKRYLLAGVISWGIGCAEPNQPGVYTRISEFRDWINQILQF